MVKKRIKKVDVKFWSVLAVLFIASVLTITLSSLNSSITGDVAIQNIAFANSGDLLNFEVNEAGVKSMGIHLIDTVKGGKIIFESKESIVFNGISYSKIDISSNINDKISQIDLILKIKESDLIALELRDPKGYINGKEKTLTFDYREGEYVFYTITLNEFGEFVIGQKTIAPIIAKAIEKSVQEVIKTPIEPIEQPQVIPITQTVSTEKGFFAKLVDFFKNLFN